MPAVYVVHSRVIALCERPFCYENPLRAIWSGFFENDRCFKHLQANDHQVSTGIQDQLSQKQFISGVGALRPSLNWMELLPISAENLPVEGYADQRMGPLYLEFSNPISMRSRGKNDVRAWGNFHVHIYPSGYVVVHLAVTLSWHRERSADEVAGLIAETYPGRAGGSWRWNSKIGSGRIHNLYLRLRTYLYSSFFETHRTMLRESRWKTVVKHNDLLSSEQLAASLWPDETYDSITTQNLLLQSILFTSQGAILNLCNREGRRGRRLACFWRMMQLYERVLLEQQIHADYFSALLASLHRLGPVFSRQVETLEGEQMLRRVVVDRSIPEYLIGLMNHRERMGQFFVYTQTAFAFWFGLVDQQRELLDVIQGWEEEMWEAGADLPAAWHEISPTLRSVLTAYEPVDPDWVRTQTGEPAQCLLWFPEP